MTRGDWHTCPRCGQLVRETGQRRLAQHTVAPAAARRCEGSRALAPGYAAEEASE